MDEELRIKLRYLHSLKRQFERGLRESGAEAFKRYDEGNFLLLRFHKEVPVPQVFWQVAGRNAKDIQKQLHDIVAAIDPWVIEKFNEGCEIVIRIPRVGLGYAIWSTPPPAAGWNPWEPKK